MVVPVGGKVGTDGVVGAAGRSADCAWLGDPAGERGRFAASSALRKSLCIVAGVICGVLDREEGRDYGI